jgi:hypothetical protein
MKRILALFFLILTCCQPVFAAKQYLGQFYDGEAKPRTEVAWIWKPIYTIKGQTEIAIHQIDHMSIKMISRPPTDMREMKAVEVLPGKHIFTVSYYMGNISTGEVYSTNDAEVPIDAKAGENYFIGADMQSHVQWSRLKVKATWTPTVTVYSPTEKDIENLNRVILERPLRVDGVVQSWEHRHLVLTLSGNVHTMDFKFDVWPAAKQRVAFRQQNGKTFSAGQKIRVLYFPSMPEEAVDFYFPEHIE